MPTKPEKRWPARKVAAVAVVVSFVGRLNDVAVAAVFDQPVRSTTVAFIALLIALHVAKGE